MAKKVGVILSGCGNRDGSEIHESVLTLLAIDEAGAEAVCMAPDIPQAQVVNFLTGQRTDAEKRNALVESARIARGKIKDLKGVRSGDFDALIIPGGAGAALTLSDFNIKGANATLQADVARLIQESLSLKKPIGVICIAPTLMGIMAKETGIRFKLTIGTDHETAESIEEMGAAHVNSSATEIVIDKENRIVSTPAYMLATRISETAQGIRKLVNAVLDLA